MERRAAASRYRVGIAVGLLVAVGSVVGPGPRRLTARGVGAAPPAKAVCTFVNPGYTGACVETTTRPPDEAPKAACQPILECLNDSRCAKTYCRSTSVRQGWTLKSAE